MINGELTHLSLFSGIGGLDLAAEWAGFKTVGQCEWADYPAKVLEKHWPEVTRWKDIRTLTGESFYERTGLRTVDIISGGFPCQPFSVAGKQRGKEDDRYLWPEMVRVIKELRPTWVVGENVAGIVRMALPDILSELGGLGYRTRAFLIPACAVGARHRRYRVAIVAYANNRQCNRQEEKIQPGRDTVDCGSEVVADTSIEGVRRLSIQPGKPRQEGTHVKWSSEDVQYPNGTEREEFHPAGKPDKEGFPGRGCDAGAGQRRAAQSGLGGMADGVSSGMDGYLDFLINHYWDEEPDIPRIASGIQNRVSRVKALGNAVVPQQFYPIFKAIANVERGISSEAMF